MTCHPAAFVTAGQCVGEKQFNHRRSSELYVQSTQLTLQKKDCSGSHIYPKGLTVGLIRTPSTQSEPMTLSLLAGNGLCGGEWVRNSKDLPFRVQFTQAVSQRMPHFGEASKSLRCPLWQPSFTGSSMSAAFVPLFGEIRGNKHTLKTNTQTT